MTEPAHKTKHVHLLVYPHRSSTFRLAQSDNGETNGSALWLGAQILSFFFPAIHINSISGRRKKAIELGSGIGLSALALASLGWDVVATDLPNVLSSVLCANISTNLTNLPPSSGMIQVRELDWTAPPDEWTWNDARTIGSSLPFSQSHATYDLLKPPFDLIISSDTLYNPDLIYPLFRTIHALSVISLPYCPVTYLCIERRDPIVIDRALLEARETWRFRTERIPPKKVAKVLERAALHWDREDWEGVEIWKLTLQKLPSQ